VSGWGGRDALADIGLRTHTGGNCLQACVAMLLGAYVGRANIPDPTPFFSSHGDEWREAYNDELGRALGLRLEEEPAIWCRERTPPIPWIACIYEPDQVANHAVLARGPHVLQDPAEHYRLLPVERVMFGLVVVPANTRRRGRWGEPLA
jgi:hypothetical protein